MQPPTKLLMKGSHGLTQAVQNLVVTVTALAGLLSPSALASALPSFRVQRTLLYGFSHHASIAGLILIFGVIYAYWPRTKQRYVRHDARDVPGWILISTGILSLLLAASATFEYLRIIEDAVVVSNAFTHSGELAQSSELARDTRMALCANSQRSKKVDAARSFDAAFHLNSSSAEALEHADTVPFSQALLTSYTGCIAGYEFGIFLIAVSFVRTRRCLRNRRGESF